MWVLITEHKEKVVWNEINWNILQGLTLKIYLDNDNNSSWLNHKYINIRNMGKEES